MCAARTEKRPDRRIFNPIFAGYFGHSVTGIAHENQVKEASIGSFFDPAAHVVTQIKPQDHHRELDEV